MQFPGSSAHEDSFFGEALPAAFLSEASREILRAKEALCQYDRSYTAVVSPTTEPSMNRIGPFVLQRPHGPAAEVKRVSFSSPAIPDLKLCRLHQHSAGKTRVVLNSSNSLGHSNFSQGYLAISSRVALAAAELRCVQPSVALLLSAYARSSSLRFTSSPTSSASSSVLSRKREKVKRN